MCNTSLSSNHPFVVAITGGMGSGKTTVSHCFEELGVPCYCADKVAADYYYDKKFIQQLCVIFGRKIFDAKGMPDKKQIAQIVFGDKIKLTQLNSLIHPRVMNDFEKWCNNHRDVPYVLFESAIIFENNLQNSFDKIICVCAPIDLRIRRILKRDDTTTELAQNRIDNQLSDEWKKEHSDYVLYNQYGPKHRQKSVEKIHNKILKSIANK